MRLHPDRAPDEPERTRREALMRDANTADRFPNPYPNATAAAAATVAREADRSSRRSLPPLSSR